MTTSAAFMPASKVKNLPSSALSAADSAAVGFYGADATGATFACSTETGFYMDSSDDEDQDDSDSALSLGCR